MWSIHSLLSIFVLANLIGFTQNNVKAIYKNPYPGSNTLVVAFGGQGLQMVMPPFEFLRMLNPYKVHKMFVRDLQRSFYQRGLAPEQDIDSACEILRKEIAAFEANRVVFFGNSSGGYASLLFGLLLEVDEVHAFVPFTNLDVSSLKDKKRLRNKYFYLIPIFRSIENKHTKFHIYYCKDSERDYDQVKDLVGENIYHHVFFDKGGHSMIKTLKEEGTLREILDQAMLKVY